MDGCFGLAFAGGDTDIAEIVWGESVLTGVVYAKPVGKGGMLSVQSVVARKKLSTTTITTTKTEREKQGEARDV